VNVLIDNGKSAADYEQQLYDHFLERVDVDSPEELIEGFRQLFVDGSGYSDRSIHLLLDKVVSTPGAKHHFKFILNRCCHILINRWQKRSQAQQLIPRLVDVFETPSTRRIVEYSRAKAVRNLRELVEEFAQSEQYAALRRLAQVVGQASDGNLPYGSRPLGTLIHRYPYLYEHCLISDSSPFEQQQTIRHLQAQVQHKFEIDLSQYVTYRVRQARLARIGGEATRIVQPVRNPTLLDDGELSRAVRQFAGRVENSLTYRDLAQRFVTHTSHPMSYRAFKDDLYQYLITSVDPIYGKRRFNNQLYQHLKNTLPENNIEPLNDMLVMRTCSQLINFLVVESGRKPQHYVFIDLISNLGPTMTTAIVIKVVLICRKVKPYVEKRFSILFNHYESSAREVVEWLVNVLENMNIAFSINFGSVDLSFIR